ncbi:hypothetical protein D3C81_1792580 [compost metagenome]
MIADFLAAELGHVAGHHEVCTFQALGLALDGCFLLDFTHVVAVKHAEAVGLLQVGDEDGLGLPAEAVNAIGEDAAHVAGAVVELAYGNRGAHAAVGAVDAFDLLHGNSSGRFSGAAADGPDSQGGCQHESV